LSIQCEEKSAGEIGGKQSLLLKRAIGRHGGTHLQSENLRRLRQEDLMFEATLMLHSKTLSQKKKRRGRKRGRGGRRKGGRQRLL
jgi:hypothetical protein